MRVVALSCLLLAAPAACDRGRSPTLVCARIAALTRATDVPALSHDACVEQLEEMRSRDSNAYDCTAACVLSANDGEAAQGCVAGCGKH